MAKITVYLKDPDEEVTIESTPPKTFLDVKSGKRNLTIRVYEVKKKAHKVWTGREIKVKDIIYLRKDVFPQSRIIRTKTEGELDD